MKVVEIEWRDHSSTHGWAKDLAKPFNIKTVGYLAEETKEAYVVVESEVQEDGRGDGGVMKWGCSTAILKTDKISLKILRK